jgi:hypothetical protein
LHRDAASKNSWNTRPKDFLGVKGASGIDWSETNTPFGANCPRTEEKGVTINSIYTGKGCDLDTAILKFLVYLGEFHRVNLSRRVLKDAQAAESQPELR